MILLAEKHIKYDDITEWVRSAHRKAGHILAWSFHIDECGGRATNRKTSEANCSILELCKMYSKKRADAGQASIYESSLSIEHMIESIKHFILGPDL